MENDVLVRINKINKHYQNKQVLFDVSFDIKKGHVVGLIGPNGAGKTTIMKAIAGLSDYDSGEITINGQRVDKNHTEQLKQVGSLIETPGIYPYMTAIENLRLYAPNATKQQLKAITDKTAVTEFATRQSKKYSLGMKQRLGVALAILNNPELVILDEPLNGLDPQTVRLMRSLIRDLADSGISVLISSHILSELDLVVDDIVLINHGHVISSTTRDQFESKSNSLQVAIRINGDQDSVIAKFQANGFQASELQNKDIFIDLNENQTINQLLIFIVENNIQVEYISQQTTTLEDSVLNLIQEDN